MTPEQVAIATQKQGSTEWGTTDLVNYCRRHDSVIRVMEPMVGFQCDWAKASDIPVVVEPCTREGALLIPLWDEHD